MLTVVVLINNCIVRACNKNKISISNTVISTLGSINRSIRACRVQVLMKSQLVQVFI